MGDNKTQDVASALDAKTQDLASAPDVKTQDLASALKVRLADTSWESQERAVYTLEAMEKEFSGLLATSKEPAKQQKTD